MVRLDESFDTPNSPLEALSEEGISPPEGRSVELSYGLYLLNEIEEHSDKPSTADLVDLVPAPKEICSRAVEGLLVRMSNLLGIHSSNACTSAIRRHFAS